MEKDSINGIKNGEDKIMKKKMKTFKYKLVRVYEEDFPEEMMNELGEEGWEIVGINHIESASLDKWEIVLKKENENK